MKKNPLSKTLLTLALLGCAATAPLQAGSFTHLFNTDPSGEVIFLGTAKWVDSGSFDGSGYVSVTDALNSQLGSILLGELDPNTPVSGFTASLKVRIGGGTVGGQPADGFSFSFANLDDPAVIGPAPVGEEGTTTGLVISMDTYDNGGEGPAMDVVLDGVLVGRAKANGAGVAGSSLVEGPVAKDPQGRGLDLSTGDVFEDLVVQMKPDGALTVTWKGFAVFKDYPTGFRPRPGQFIIGGRTGGVNENNWVDNLNITTTTAPATGPYVSASTPPQWCCAGAGPTVQFTVKDGTTTLDRPSVAMTFDGNPTSPTVHPKIGDTTTIDFRPAGLLDIGSTHTAILTYQDSANPAVASSYSITFNVTYPYTVGTLFIEAEDFNFDHGSTISDQPVGMTGPYEGNSFFSLGSGIGGTVGDGSDFGIDYFESNPGNDQNIYRPGTGVEAGKQANKTSGATGPAGVHRNGFDVTANFVVGWNDVGDWFNYTRQFPPLPPGRAYKVYARLASGGAAESARLDLVTSDTSVPDQTTTKLGEFNAPATGNWDIWHLVPLKDASGNDAVVKVKDLQTVRFTTLPGNLDFDYLAFVPQDVPLSLPPYVSSTIPSSGGFGAPDQTVLAVITDRDTKVVAGSIKLSVDNVDVTAGSIITDTLEGATVSYKPATLFGPSTTHRVKVTFRDTTVPPEQLSSEFSFSVGAYQTIPASFASKPGDVDTGLPGFKARLHQMAIQRFPGDPNAMVNAERQLWNLYIDPATGLPYDNLINLPDPNGFLDVETFINWTGDATEAGNFQTANGFTDAPIPGIPGTSGSTDSIVAEILTFVKLTAGSHRLGINSDDGFKVSTGPNPRDVFSPVLGIFDGGRGAADTQFDVYVAADGIYPIRLSWWEGTGGANVEFFAVNTATGVRTLVNDTAGGTPIEAYREGKLDLPYVAFVRPYVNGVGAAPDEDIQVIIYDGVTEVAPGSIQISLDGTPLTVVAVKDSGRTVATAALPGILTSLSTHIVSFQYKHGTPAATVNNSWSFTVRNYPTLPIQLATPLGSGDSSQPGFKIKVWQVPPGTGSGGFLPGDPQNRVSRAESELRGLTQQDGLNPTPYRPNVADLTGANPDGTFDDLDVINWSGDGGIETPTAAGNFTVNNGYPDEPIPGIPGTSGSTDFIAAEVLTYVEFPTAGIYTMGVNSDDGFRTSPAESAGLDGTLRIGSPSDVAGSYYMIEGGSGWVQTLAETGPVAGEVVLADPGEGCQDLINAAAVRGKIVLIFRGTCRFDNKVAYAKKAGAAGVIIANNRRDGVTKTPLEMGGDPNEGARVILGVAQRINIPAVMIAFSDGDMLRAKLNTGAKMTAHIGYETTTLGVFDGGRGASDSTFSFGVPTPGVYPIRTVWFEGDGGANLELFMVTKAGDKILLNDSSNEKSLKTYRTRTPAATIGIGFSGGNLVIDFTGILQSSTDVTGPYTDAGIAAVPYKPMTSDAKKFYRSRSAP